MLALLLRLLRLPSDAALLVVYNGMIPCLVPLRSTNTDTTVVNTLTADEIHAFQ
jgi:hypothetical protein